MRPERIPLFPLNVVLLPGAELPLHIFEPRYREMVRNALENKAEFGMLLALPSGMAPLGCTAEIMEVLKREDDGAMDIMTVGRAPFRVLELFAEAPLLEGHVEYLTDCELPLSTPVPKALLELYETCYTLVFGDYPEDLGDDLPASPSYLIAGILPMDLLCKQQILELRSEAARQDHLLSYLREWAPHLQKAASVREHAGGNGHGLN